MDPILFGTLVRVVPKDRELGGLLRGGHGNLDTSDISSVELVAGPRCIEDDGRHSSVCRVTLPHALPTDRRFHTHPKANRPSSVDLASARVAVDDWVVSPLGVWTHRLNPSWRTLTSAARQRETLHWKLLGALLQKRLQTGCLKAASEFCDGLGPHAVATFTPTST